MVSLVDDGERTQSDLELDRGLRRMVAGAKSEEAQRGLHQGSRRRVAAMLFGEETDQDEEPAPLSAGPQIEQIHRYEVRSLIGSGAMGRVFEAYDPQLARQLAIKVLHPGYSDEAKARARIVREAQALARLSHPNVIQVYDVGDSEVGFFIAMEWVPGKTLREVVRSSDPRQWRCIMDYFLAAGEGLAAAHAAKLVHRDFKPENVIVGDDNRVRVLDFGLARPLGPGNMGPATLAGQDLEGNESQGADATKKLLGLTQTGAMIGTPIYMAPELYKGGVADAKSDQFAYCVALFDALYRQRPFDGNNVETYAKAVVAGAFCPPSLEAGSDQPETLLGIIQKGLSLDPDKRYATMAELLSALREAIAIPIPAARRRRRNFAVLLGACLLTAVVVSQLRGGEGLSGELLAKVGLGAAVEPARAAEPSEGGSASKSSSAVRPESGQPAASKSDTSVEPAESKAKKNVSPERPATQESPRPAAPPAKPQVDHSKTKPAKSKRKSGADSRRSGWCSLHEDTYRLLRRDRRRKSRFRSRSGRCFGCRIEARLSRTRQFYPRNCLGYQLCGPVQDRECDSPGSR